MVLVNGLACTTLDVLCQEMKPVRKEYGVCGDLRRMGTDARPQGVLCLW